MNKFEINFMEEWSQFFDKEGEYSWYDFTLINAYALVDKVFGRLEFSFKLLGLGFYVTYQYKETATGDEIAEEITRIRDIKN